MITSTSATPKRIRTQTKDNTYYLRMIFARIKQSCYQPNHPSYKNYGGRGIKIAPEWLISGTSREFVKWALASGYTHEQALEIDRRDNDGDYGPDNCAFVTPSANARNRRNTFRVEYQGQQWNFCDLMDEIYGIEQWDEVQYNAVRERVQKLGWSVEDAFNTPYVKGQRSKRIRHYAL